MFLILTLLLFLTICLYWYYNGTKNYGKYSAKGLVEDPPMFPFGSSPMWNLILGRKHFINNYDALYQKYTQEKFLISWEGSVPITVIRDLDLCKSILIKDFDHFTDRRMTVILDKEANKYFVNSLLMLEGNEWKTFRSILSPIFTSGKLKFMTKHMHNVGNDLISYISSKENEEMECHDLNLRHTTSVIASCVFGLQTYCFSETKEDPFYKAALRLTGFEANYYKVITQLFIMSAIPSLSKLLKFCFFDKESSDFLIHVFRQSLQERKTKCQQDRNDLTDILMKELESNESNDTDTDEELLLLSNAFLFFFAGFSTSSMANCIVSHYLAKNSEIQEKLFSEISNAIDKNNGNEDLDYNTIVSLPYLDSVVNESLRIQSLTPLSRKCVKDYKIPGSSHMIKRGECILIPSGAIMKDEIHYSNPNVFDPSGHFPEKDKPFSFLAFGQGPRNCIGIRFAQLQIKSFLLRLVYNFIIYPTEKTIEVLDPNPRSQNGMPKGGFWLKYKKR